MPSNRSSIRQSYNPLRFWLLGAVAAVVLLAGFALFEYGMMRAGYNRRASVQEYEQLSEQHDALQKESKKQRERIAILETAAKIDKAAYRQVEDRLVELQTEIQLQSEDLNFYKGIVNANEGSGLRIQDFRVSKLTGDHSYHLSVVLAQALRSNKKISGQIDVIVEGLRAGEVEKLNVRQLIVADKATGSLKFGFRYFQDLQADVTFPEDFEPERVFVRVRLQGKSSKTVEESFDWRIKSG